MLSDDKQDDAACGSIQPKHLPVGDVPTAGKLSASAQVSGRFRGWRGWVLRMALLVASPVLFCGLAELALRAAGYGYPTSFFLGPDERGYHSSNVQFGWRFFPRQLARKPEPCLLPPRSPDTTRIFILGESAALGMPNPAFSFGRILEVMLHERYPGCRFEILNTSMTAINSHAILEIAKDCSTQGGDLFVIYMGNNEVVGPYGPGTVFQQVARRRAAVRMAIWVKSTRLGQLMGDVTDRFRGSDDVPANWQGMQMFLGSRMALDDPRLTLVYDNFDRNLAGICDVAKRSPAAVILATVAVNLRDCPPLASLHRPDLSPEALGRWQKLYASGAEAASRRDWADALVRWEEAAEIDDGFAELQYRLGECLAALNRQAEAQKRFELARDLDALRFRADSRINAIVREVAASRRGQNVRLADAERIFSQETGLNAGPGEEQFYEHVHLTFAGNYLLARTVLEQVAEVLPPPVRSRSKGHVPDRAQCAERLAFTPWDEFHMAETMATLTSNPPFTEQLHHAARQAAAEKRVEDLRRTAVEPEALRKAVTAYEQALAARPDDWYLHNGFAYLAKSCGAWDVAVGHWRTVLQPFPGLADQRAQLAEVLLNQGKAADAAAEYQVVLATHPQDAGAHNGLGMALLRQGDLDLSIDHFRKAIQVDAEYYAAHVNLGMALSEQGKLEEAVTRFKEALKIDPERAESHVNLATILYRQSEYEAAIQHCRELVRLQPDSPEWLNQLASILSTCPSASVRNGSESVELAQKAVAQSGGQEPLYLDTLAAAYAESADFAKAVETAEQATALAYRQNKFALANTLRSRIALYKARSPLRN